LNSVLCLLLPLSDIFRVHPKALWDTNQGICGTSRNLSSPQAVKPSATDCTSQYAKKGSFYSKIISDSEMYKKFYLVYFDLNRAGNQPSAMSPWTNFAY
jgi:hypothetical protein